MGQKMSYPLESFNQSEPLLINQNASEVKSGTAKLATQELMNAGKDDSTIVTPLKIVNYLILSETITKTIYVSTSGNDIAGDGSVDSPYLTIGQALSTVKKIINSGITITISVGVGTFSMSTLDINVLRSLTGAGTLIIQGTLVLVDSGFTMGAALALDPLTFAVSGGNTASWASNQWKFYFLKSGANYYPITANTLTPTISIAGEFTGTEIYQAQTIITINETSLINGVALNFTNVSLNIGSNGIFIYNDFKELIFTNCYIYGTGELTFNNNTACRLHRSATDGINLTFKSAPLTCLNNYFYRNGSNFMILLYPDISRPYQLLYNVFENPNTASFASAIYFNNIGKDQITLNYYMKFVNCNVAINYSLSTDIDYARSYSKVILINVNYFLRKHYTALPDNAAFKINMLYSNFYGAPVIRWIYDTMYEFVNISSGRNIRITGLIYPEIEQNQESPLANNASTNIIVGNKSQNRSIHVDYLIFRGSGYRKGSFDIINDGNTLSMSPDIFITNNDIGVIDGAISLSVNYNVNEIRIAALLDDKGAGILYYNVNRVMIKPLTI
jgi:hypothetical protein